MEWVVWVLLEKPLALAAVLFTPVFVLLVYWRRSGRARPLLIGLAAAVLLFIIQALVVTRREHALRVLAGIERDIVASQTENLAAALAPDFRAGPMGRDEFVAYVQRQYEEVRVRLVQCSEFRVQASQPERFVVAAAYQGDVVTGDYVGWVRTRWEITFARTEVGWRIVAIQPTYIDGIHQPNWERVNRR